MKINIEFYLKSFRINNSRVNYDNRNIFKKNYETYNKNNI